MSRGRIRVIVPGSICAYPATTVRVQEGKTITTDGPFVATKEALNGYLTYEAEDLDAAIELAADAPTLTFKFTTVRVPGRSPPSALT